MRWLQAENCCTTMDFDTLPPEINSARIYSGPGSGPMLASAAAWDALAAELDAMATRYSALVADLTDDLWRGPASASMASAATRNVAWMRTTAGHAGQAADQAKAAVGAYESAFAMTVPPHVIAANRGTLASLIATNFLGQNTPAIAATEAQYGEMWAQDVVAMRRYDVSSASASNLTPFASLASTARDAASTIGQVISTVDLVVTDLIFTANLAVASANLGMAAATLGKTSTTGNATSSGENSQVRPVAGAQQGSVVSASTGRAATVGRLSVPPSWGYSPAMRQVAAVLPSTPALPATEQASSKSPYSDVAWANLAASYLAGLSPRGRVAANAAPPALAGARRTTKPEAITISAASLPDNLAAALAAMPGATVVLMPATPSVALPGL